MIKNTLHLIILIISISSVFSQEVENKKDSITDELSEFSQISDGPYVFIEKNKLIEKTIINGKVSSRILKVNTFDTIFPPEKSTFNSVTKIAALSDIHGQYDLAIEILKNNKIIDKNLNWNFDKGHLVIAGDIFDRGNKVNEMLWLVYKLEAQAKSKGGHVHFLLGNHEYMVLHNDLRYVSEKYLLASKLLNLEYSELYSNKTVLGRWLRSKSTIIKINDYVFVHGGVSEDFIAENDLNFEKINDIMRTSIDRTKREMKSTNFYNIYYGSKSLIWYRGYFYDNLLDSDISKILKLMNSKHIIVGHCSNDEIVQLYNNKIFGVDSSIKKGKYGEILFIKNNQFFRGTLSGDKIQF
ncbi:metallophosphoesterase [Sabulilitoribacter multivorans]|uniref:Metallophosphoesterase n=1 Tax=Flaviramulus multivorans TaxID=1304750 RepID=A0ABS9IFV2_9FLAO|nr:metallophosphoesterase [Flaviramulus multivorans]MCF7559485.1 metallophosphoesterase [Flaviramulus multivorans]